MEDKSIGMDTDHSQGSMSQQMMDTNEKDEGSRCVDLMRNNNNNEEGQTSTRFRSMDDSNISRSGSSSACSSSKRTGCGSPISSIVGAALNQMQLKRSSSAPMINQLGLGAGPSSSSPDAVIPETPGVSPNLPSSSTSAGLASNCSTNVAVHGSGVLLGRKDEVNMSGEMDPSAYANSFLSLLGGPRPRRFSASFSPVRVGSPGPAPNRVNQLRHENTTDWETVSEKEFHGTQNIAQSWEDLSLDSMSMEVSGSAGVVNSRRPSISDQLWLSMPASSAPSSPAASPRVLSRFSPSLSSPSPTRKSFTTRRSLSPIAVRPSVLSLAGGSQGVKRKCDWESNGMDCSPQPAKRSVGLLAFNAGSPSNHFSSPTNPFSFSNSTQVTHPHQHHNNPFSANSSSSLLITNPNSVNSVVPNRSEDSPFSNAENETESSISSIGACDSPSPFFRPVDSPLASATTSPEDSPLPPPNPKMI